MVGCLLIAALVTAAGFFGYSAAAPDDGSTGEEGPTTSTRPSTTTTASPSSTEGAPTTGDSGADGPTTPDDDAGGTIAPVEIELEDRRFTLRGTVPDETVADRLEFVVDDTYEGLGSIDLTVDGAAAAAPWHEHLPTVVRAFAGMIDGAVSIDGTATVLRGRSPDGETIDGVVAGLSEDRGFPPLDRTGVEVASILHASVSARAEGGVLTLTGVVPDQRLQDRLVADAGRLYDPDQLVDELMLDPDTHASTELALLGRDLAVLAPGGDLDVGVVDGAFFARLYNGITFEQADDTLTDDSRALLRDLAQLVIRKDVELRITGHTDDIGSPADNLALSEARAQTVADVLEAEGVDPVALIVIGKGESEPVADNAGEEGQARNRRVELSIGPAAEPT